MVEDEYENYIIKGFEDLGFNYDFERLNELTKCLNNIGKYTSELETKLQQIREYCEEAVNRNKKELTDLEALPPKEYKVNESWNEYHKGYYLAEKELCEGILEVLNSGGAE